MSKDKRNATQRIEDLEHALMSLYQTADNMARDLTMVKDAIKLLGNKLDAVVKASERGAGVNDTVVASIMVENNVADLKEKADRLVAQGILVAEEAVGEKSFVVSREQDDQGNIVNPRLQFTMGSLTPELRAKIVGGMPGQVITLEEGKLKLEILETYSIQTPSAQSTEESESVPASESTEESAESNSVSS